MKANYTERAKVRAMAAQQRRKDARDLFIQEGGRVCAICGKQMSKDETTIDHIIPLSKGGADIIQNMQLACLACNNAKGDNLPSDF